MTSPTIREVIQLADGEIEMQLRADLTAAQATIKELQLKLEEAVNGWRDENADKHTLIEADYATITRLEATIAQQAGVIAAMREALQSTMHYTTCYHLHFPDSGAFVEAQKANALLNDTAQLAANHDATIREPAEAYTIGIQAEERRKVLEEVRNRWCNMSSEEWARWLRDNSHRAAPPEEGLSQ